MTALRWKCDCALTDAVYLVFRTPDVMPAFFLAARSPSPSHLLALTSWIMFMICFPSMTGALMPAKIHGTVLSILFALAISRAPADQGFANNRDGFGCAGEPGWAAEIMFPELGPVPSSGMSREGESVGDEKDRRYKAIKKSSLRAQKTNSTVYRGAVSRIIRQLGKVTYPICIIQMQVPVSLLIHLLVTLTASTHREGGIHVDVVARKIQADQSLEHYTPSWEC